MSLEISTNAAAIPERAKDHPHSAFGRDIAAALFKDCLVYLFLLGLIVRTGFMIEHMHSPTFDVPSLDQKYYDTVAKMLLAGQDLHPLRGFRPLLYPMFVAFFYKLGGTRGIELTVAAQHLLGVGTGVLVALLAARLFRHRLSGLAAGVLYLLAPIPLYFEGELLVESSYVFLICLTLLLILHAAAADGRKAALLWLLCGGLTVLTAQVRPNILVFMAVYPFFACWRWWQSRLAGTFGNCQRNSVALTAREALPHPSPLPKGEGTERRGLSLSRESQALAFLPLLALAGAAVMAIPWGFVNKKEAGYFQVVPTTGGVNLYLGNRRTADGVTMQLDSLVNYDPRYEDSVEVWARHGYESAMRAEGRQPDPHPKAISQYWTHRAIDEIKADPAAWLRLMAKKCWLTFWNTEVPTLNSFAFLQTEYTWLRLLPVRWVVLLMLAPVGIWAAAKWGDRDTLVVLLFYVSIYLAANVAFFIVDRYRYPVWPAMAAIGGGGLLAFIDTIRSRRWRWALGLAAAMAAMAALSLPNWFGAKLPSFALDYRLRSLAWYEKGQFPQALSDIDQSLLLNPNDVTALAHRGNVLMALNRLDEARRDQEAALKINPGDAGVWNNYGAALDGLGRTNEALQAFQRAIECHPPSQTAIIGMAFEQIRCGQLDAVPATLEKLDGKQPDLNAMALALRSVIAQKQGNPKQAAALEQQARTLDANAAAWAIARATKQP